MSGIISKSPDMNSGIVGKYPAGHTLQMSYVQNSSGDADTSGTTLIDAPQLTLTMTPTHINSKFYMFANIHVYINANGDDGWRVCNTAFHRSISGGASAVVYNSGSTYSWGVHENDDANRFMQRIPFMWLDSPSTTSAVTYKVQFKAGGTFQVLYSPGYALSDMTLMEIAG